MRIWGPAAGLGIVLLLLNLLAYFRMGSLQSQLTALEEGMATLQEAIKHCSKH